MKFVFACDSFKGTISSARCAELLVQEAARVWPDCSCSCVPVADGGEGTVEALVSCSDGRLVTRRVSGPLGAPVEASFAMLGSNQALVEMAAASGLPLISRDDRNPLNTSTFGTGELIRAALDEGARDISLAIGGSATNDGGMGCMCALGMRFLDSEGNELSGVGADLERVASIDASHFDTRIAECSIHVLCDVDNPLLGERGATYVFGPQKGATPEIANRLEAGMTNYARVLEATFGVRVSDVAGMGAAGGLGAGSAAMLGAELVGGVDQVLDLVGLSDELNGANLCITGEGHADSQSAHGKVISGVAKRCQAVHVPCIAIVGGMDADATELLDFGVDALVPTVIDAASVEDVLQNAERNFVLAAQRVFALINVGSKMGGNNA